MPIDPNIALGVRPVEQTNMLGQLGQVMALKAAQQEMQGNQQVSDYFSNPNRGAPEELLKTKAGRDAYAKMNEGKIKQLEAGKKQSELLGNIFGGVMQDPTTGPAAVSRLVTMGALTKEQAQQALAEAGNDPEKWKTLASPYYQESIDSVKRFQDQTEIWKAKLQSETSIKTANIGAAPGHERNVLDREKYLNPNLTPVQGSMQIPDSNAPGGFRTVETFAGFHPKTGVITPSQVRAPAAPPTIANSLAMQQPAPAVNNALNPNFITSPSSPVVPSAAATMPNVSAVAPSVALPNTPAQAAMFAPKPSAQQEKQAQVEVERARGKGEVADVIGSLASKYTDLAKTGGMTSTKKGTLENIGAYLSSTGAGQELGKMTATQEQSLRNEIKAQSPILLEGIKKATGMTAKELDSNADVKRWMEAMGSPTFDIQSTLGILKSLNKQFGSGGEISAAPAATVAPNIKSLLDKYK